MGQSHGWHLFFECPMVKSGLIGRGVMATRAVLVGRLTRAEPAESLLAGYQRLSRF